MTELPAGPRAPSGGWRTATVAGVRHPLEGAVELRLDVHDRVDHLPGQHYVVRLTAPDGYTAQRSYSVASAPGDPLVELFVERLEDGEVSTFLADVVEPGDELEVRGPIGGWFVWEGECPALLVGGGTGVVPFVAMLRTARALGRTDLLRVAAATRTLAGLPYADELVDAGALVVSSREAHGIRPAGRLTAADLVPLWEPEQTAYVCGSESFAEAASQLLVGMGVPAPDIRVERFGPSG
ncbi:FAD-binding oxidoreductase [Geodermatophilus sabuli]|uniref:Ferredoxin-NADP reductase n=1 Tax=Geodermatophilus sabuli TaxID=1564158 RepID=A0A285EJ71_9ACTN|nr:FAD-binding oxidoreductase [Geodermatophilus sabuli]MBB3083054.1 ferredoxin-NADP reductase [Geodermatophilus sabuli]SNX98051.1 Ferredoxin-NADP reductase [Geodermatophilus sabuli]